MAVAAEPVAQQREDRVDSPPLAARDCVQAVAAAQIGTQALPERPLRAEQHLGDRGWTRIAGRRTRLLAKRLGDRVGQLCLELAHPG